MCEHLFSFVTLVNKGNCSFSSGQYDKARDYYQEALRFVIFCIFYYVILPYYASLISYYTNYLQYVH